MAKAVIRSSSKKRYHDDAYRFVVEALHHTQQRLSRPRPRHVEDDSAHITGQELLAGLKEFASQSFGMLAYTVLRSWGLQSTEDVGRIVFELIEHGEMKKTDRDQLSDFSNLYDFREAFVDDYVIEIPQASLRS